MSCEMEMRDAKVGHYIMALDDRAYLRHAGPSGTITEGFPRDFIERHLAVGDRFLFRDVHEEQHRTLTFESIEPWGTWEHPA